MIEITKGGVRLHLFIQPKSSKNEVVGLHNGLLKIKITAPPIDGKANEGLIKFLSDFFDIPKRDIVLVRGETGRTKTVELLGMSEQLVKEKLKL
ncbi:DUF167 domain-containing protein [Bdellovibrio svalbardensis]|uniref:UPF0235 protein NWE73_11915 n=1 Tax=Bdellovibrio svalbardensis TaxID=2972972 RepID=A0ABT6DJQ3_9BACT|nr:DUF167 domain-containing protein [Bdellovibrio svalbardensis]MDG0817077.1 DUF167 domain-containing protein [Bdellovibrio svalbardensis]